MLLLCRVPYIHSITLIWAIQNEHSASYLTWAKENEHGASCLIWAKENEHSASCLIWAKENEHGAPYLTWAKENEHGASCLIWAKENEHGAPYVTWAKENELSTHSSKTNKMQRYTMVFITIKALHVSGGSSAYNQELKTVYTASGMSSNSLTIAVRSRKFSTNTQCFLYSFELRMMGGGTAWNM